MCLWRRFSRISVTGKGDAQVGVRTIPVIIGDKNTKALLTSVTLIIGCGILLCGASYLPVPVLTLLAIWTVLCPVLHHFHRQNN